VVDEQVATALIDLDDSNIMLDLRQLNGKTNLMHFGVSCRCVLMNLMWQ